MSRTRRTRVDPEAGRRQWEELVEVAAAALEHPGPEAFVLFHFARKLKAWPWEIGTGDSVADYIEDMFRFAPEWSEPGHDPWEVLGVDDGGGDARGMFVRTYEQVQFPEGQDPLTLAARAAEVRPFIPRRALSTKHQTFLSIAGHLQLDRGDGTIFIGQHRFAGMLGVSQQVVSHYVRQSMADGLLTRRRLATKGSRRASEYNFHLERFRLERGRFLEVP